MPSLSDQIPGLWLRHHATAGDLVVIRPIEEYEYGASLAFYSGHPILMVRRRASPNSPSPSPRPRTISSPTRNCTSCGRGRTGSSC